MEIVCVPVKVRVCDTVFELNAEIDVDFDVVTSCDEVVVRSSLNDEEVDSDTLKARDTEVESDKVTDLDVCCVSDSDNDMLGRVNDFSADRDLVLVNDRLLDADRTVVNELVFECDRFFETVTVSVVDKYTVNDNVGVLVGGSLMLRDSLLESVRALDIVRDCDRGKLRLSVKDRGVLDR